MMERSARMRMAQENQEMQRAEFQAKLPVIIAQQGAELASARASVANATRMEQLRARAAQESVAANDEFLEAMKYANWNTKADALAGLQAKYNWMSLLPEYKGFVDTINNERAQAHVSAITDMKLEEQMEISQRSLETRERLQEEAGVLRKQLAEAAAAAAKQRNDADNEGALERTKIISNAPAERVRSLEAAADVADRDGDVELATALRARLKKEVAPTGRSSSRRELPPAVASALGVKPQAATSDSATPKTVQTPVGDRPIPPGTKLFRADGKDYPIATDAQGRRAYYKDGKWIELPAGK